MNPCDTSSAAAASAGTRGLKKTTGLLITSRALIGRPPRSRRASARRTISVRHPPDHAPEAKDPIGSPRRPSDQGPRSVRPAPFDRRHRQFGIAALITTGCLGLALWAAGQGGPWQTLLFATLALAQLGVALTTRSDRIPFWRMTPAGNPFLYYAVAASLAATVAAIYLPGLSDLLGSEPLSALELGLAAAVAAVPAVVIELVELARARRTDLPVRPDRPGRAAPARSGHGAAS
ncbi:cation-translocating P-type ATPase C-terminal domain-containing protein [Pseudonocardia hydrocarbonoxydans]|uniref:cation-translocating P-type ATPase C-terminal domain-containing protein n=1 Tax=Pseudonocardia hydrocarbonoxydans TaxID=76726 RepID=UPI0031DA0350